MPPTSSALLVAAGLVAVVTSCSQANRENRDAANPSDTAGGCDLAGVFRRNGCTKANCHGTQFQGGVDLATPGYASRLVGVRSETDACGGQVLVDPKNPDDSLLLRLVDANRFARTPGQCGVMMPFGSKTGIGSEDVQCIENWINAVGANQGEDQSLVFESVSPESYVAKIKTLLHGGAVTAEELNQVRADPSALRTLVSQWTSSPEFQAKMFDFFRIALQQKLVGTLNFQLNTLQGPHRAELRANAEESFLRTAWDTVAAGRPFTEIVTTHRFAVTTGLLAALAYTDNTNKDLRADRHVVYRDPPAGAPPAPWSVAYSVANKSWLFPDLPAACDNAPLNGYDVFDLIMGSVPCPAPTGNQEFMTGTVLTSADYADWRFVEIATADADHPPPRYYDLDALRSASTIVYLRQPRVGFFTTPVFFANWDTNDSNQFRVTASQTVITALGEVFSPADSTTPVRLDGLNGAHAVPTSTCYGCHQFIDPMRGYFSQSFSTAYQAPMTPPTLTPSFAFHGYTHDGGNLDEFGATLASHPLFPSAWVQKLCYYANSQSCEPSDPEFQRIARAFQDSNFDFLTLVRDLFTSPLVTGGSAVATYASQDYLVSITRRQHFCQMIDVRLGTVDTCKNVGSMVGLIPEDRFSRGDPAFVQPAVTSLFHFAAAEKVCMFIARRLVGPNKRFTADDATTAIDQIVSGLMGLSSAHSRAAEMRDRLTNHYKAAQAAGATETDALRDTFSLACMSPDVMALGF